MVLATTLPLHSQLVSVEGRETLAMVAAVHHSPDEVEEAIVAGGNRIRMMDPVLGRQKPGKLPRPKILSWSRLHFRHCQASLRQM
jgi:hypothetical protein